MRVCDCGLNVLHQTADKDIREASHAYLAGLITRPTVFSVCDHIQLHSNNDTALFHSAVCLRQGAMHRWHDMQVTDRQAVQTRMLEYALLHAKNQTTRAVASVLIGGVALLLKRGWGEMSNDDKESYFQVLTTGP